MYKRHDTHGFDGMIKEATAALFVESHKGSEQQSGLHLYEVFASDIMGVFFT
jgi:hypothetical protein